MLLLLIDTFWGCQSSFAFILQGFFVFFFVCIKCAHELPLRAPTGLSASLSSPCSCKPVTRDLQLVPTQSRSSVSDWQRRLSHFFSLQQRLCNKPKSIFLNLFPPCVVILGCVTRVCFDYLDFLITLLEVAVWEWANNCIYLFSELQWLRIHFPQCGSHWSGIGSAFQWGGPPASRLSSEGVWMK